MVSGDRISPIKDKCFTVPFNTKPAVGGFPFSHSKSINTLLDHYLRCRISVINDLNAFGNVAASAQRLNVADSVNAATIQRGHMVSD